MPHSGRIFYSTFPKLNVGPPHILKRPCAPFKHFGRAEAISEYLAVDLCAVSGSDDCLASFVGLIGGILNRPVEPLLFGFRR